MLEDMVVAVAELKSVSFQVSIINICTCACTVHVHVL